VAQTLQASVLPAALPQIPGATVATEYVAAGEGMDVGGEGAEAGAVTALARYTVRAVAGRSPSPAATSAALNDECCGRTRTAGTLRDDLACWSSRSSARSAATPGR
jgi:hypothetical protein